MFQIQDTSETSPENGGDEDSEAATEEETGNSILDNDDDQNAAEVIAPDVDTNPISTESNTADLDNRNDDSQAPKNANEDEAIFKLETHSTTENSASAVSTTSLSSEEEVEQQPVSMETASDGPPTRPPKIVPPSIAIACERRDSGVISSASNVAMTVPGNRDVAAVAAAGGSAEGSAASSLRVPAGTSVASGGGGVEMASSAPQLNFEPAPLLQEFAFLHLSDNLVLVKSDVKERVIIIDGKGRDSMANQSGIANSKSFPV